MTDKKGKKYRFILVGDRFYSGTIISEDKIMITIKDKFGETVSFGKQNIISMEEVL